MLSRSGTVCQALGPFDRQGRDDCEQTRRIASPYAADGLRQPLRICFRSFCLRSSFRGLTFALSRAAQRHLTTDGKPRRLQRKLDLVWRHDNSG